MFIKDGKMLFSNTSLILAILILILLLFLSYNKCVVKSEGFYNENQNQNQNQNKNQNQNSNENILPEPVDVRINIKGNRITLNFNADMSNNKPLPKHFLIVLVQYDSNYKITGNNKFYLSDEYQINSAVGNRGKASNLCLLMNGISTCQYVFEDIDIIDANGNLYYYKIGISAVYETGNSNFVMPYNINSNNKLFTLDNTLETQNNIYNEFIQFKISKEFEKKQNEIPNSQLMSSADGQYELIKSQLGGYPDNLILDSSANNYSLSQLVDKSMAKGILNINVISDVPEIK